MNALLAFIRPRLLLAEGLLLLPTTMALAFVARCVMAWEHSFKARCNALHLLDAIHKVTQARSTKP